MNLQTKHIFGRQLSEPDASGDTTRDVELSSAAAAQGQIVKPVGSAAARFQIRSAKTLQFGPAKHIYQDRTAVERSKEEMKTFYESNKSKSLDWRGAGSRTGYRNTTGVSSGTQMFGEHLRRSESLNRNDPNSQITSYTEDNQPNSVPRRFQGSSVTVQRDRKDYPNSESTPDTMNPFTLAMEKTGGGQSLPVRLKSRLSQCSIGDNRSPSAQVQHGDSCPDQTDNKIGIWVREQGLTNTEEVTGNQTIMERIEKLYRANCTDTKSDMNSKHLLNEKRNCTSDSGQVLCHRKTCTDSPSGPLSPSDSQQTRPSNTVEKSGTFPRWLSKNEQTFIDKNQEPSTPEIRNDQGDASAGVFLAKPRRMETHTHKKFQSFTAADEKTSKIRSLERTRSNLSDIAQPSGTHAQSTGLEGGSNISNRQQPLIAKSGGIKKETKKEEPTQPKYPLSSRGVAHSETYQEDPKAEGRKGDGLLESSPDSVKNTIHKFEALMQQSQSAPQILRPRRTLSVPEQPKPVIHVKKSDSDLNLKFTRVMENTESVGTNPGNKVKEPAGNLDLNRTPQSNLTVQVKPTSEQKMKTYKTSIDIIPTFPKLHEPKPYQPNTYDKNRTTVRNRHMDEPDLAIVPRSGLPNTGTIEKKSRNPTFQPTGSQQSNDNRLIKQQSIRVNMDDDEDDYDGDDTPTNSPNRDPITINMQSQSNTVNPQTPAHTSNIGVFTSVNSAANGTHPKAVSNPSASLGPAHTLFSSLNNSNNNNINTTSNDPSTYGIWSSDEEDDVEDYEGTDSGDSDSGESSVTITSNMSKSDRKSFSLSYVELCIYGGVDYKPSDGSLSENGEDWAPSRSASLSSNMSGFSSVTLLSNHEMDRLLEDVKNLGEDTLQKYADIQVVVLHKEVGCGLGFTLAGGVDQNKPVTVHRVIAEGVAAQEGSIFEGDWVLSINGTPLQKCAHWEALRMLRKTRIQAMAVVVLQRDDQNETQHRKEAVERPETGKGIYVTVNKSSYDLGFSLEGGVDSCSGDKPLTVQKVFQGGPVNKVFPGDELLEVQGKSLMGMRRLEAWNLIRRLPPGPVEVLLHRPHQPY
ncbi:PDZ domain-containing protein 2 [Triplophysa tibetana]|uniref:PDZ domain-containing protein 2 n=1 Tax=Triplophysa tibetana TaxID=1572043 RepID=A0A5A9N2N7_9TELE|nr:PDZ domain-containing protein 2 [Triplophysa tibetana]